MNGWNCYQAVPEVEPVKRVPGVAVVRDLVLPDEADGGHQGREGGPVDIMTHSFFR